jgi:hypothetical protein
MALQVRVGARQTGVISWFQTVPVLCLLTREGTGAGTPGADSHFLRGFLPSAIGGAPEPAPDGEPLLT